MMRCLNPKKAHENRGTFVRPVPSGKTVALIATTSSEVEEAGEEEQAACQYCKYLLEGAILGDCRVIRWIGSGAFGDVYEAEQLPPLSRRVAIKVMALERVVDGESAEMFAREVSTIAALDHPHILPVLRVGMIDDGRPYLVMKYAAQGSLQQFCLPAAPSFTSPSLLPTIARPHAVATPANEQTISSASTLTIVQALEEITDTATASLQRDADESEETLRKKAPNAETAALPDSLQDDEAGGEDLPESQQTTLPAVLHELTEEASGEDLPEDLQATLPVLQQQEGSEADDADQSEVQQTMLQVTQSERAVAQQKTDADENTRAEGESAQAETRPDMPDASSNEVTEEASIQVVRAEIAVLETLEVEQISTLVFADAPRSETLPLVIPSVPSSALPPLSLQQVLKYVEEAAAALAYAHQRGLIHLDVKPANLLLDAQGRLMLADFGVSVLLEGYTHASLHYYVGTPLYTAPEQWLEQPRTASDQYALAVACYQLLTGRPPFTGNLYAVMHGHLQVTPQPMNPFNPLITPQIEMVVQRALAKEPADRYPDILAFARALREAIEGTASSDTPARLTLFPQQMPEFVSPTKSPLTPVETDELTEDIHLNTSKQDELEAGTFRTRRAERTVSSGHHHPLRSHWLRNLLLFVLALLLIAGGSLSFVRAQRPCWLGICPQILLSNHAITLTNNEIQPISITNTGTDTLHWTASLHPSASWLSLNTSKGTLAPRHTTKIVLRTDVDNLAQSGTYTDMIDIDGGPGVLTQAIEVTENVVKGLSAVSVSTSGQTFLYEQGHLQPGREKITITNQSGHTLNWFTQYTDNNWLSVTPSQGSLANHRSVVLIATVENPQKLANDTYQVRFSLVGQLDNQSDFTLLQTLNFSLQVNQSQTAQVAPTARPSTQPTPVPTLSFTAQPVAASGAPTLQRANHSMVWDTQDRQLLVFGGSDAQGNLLNDLWSYSPSTNKWTNLTPDNADISASDCSGGSPAPRRNAAFVWDSADQQALLYGGVGDNNSYLGDLWAYSPAKGSWSALACSGNGPGARGNAGVAWNGSQMLLLGGAGNGGTLADFWAYTPGSGGWSEISATTPLGAREYPTMAWDEHDKQLYVFGGLAANGQQLGDFYVYQPGSGWSTIEASNGTAPLPRQQALGTWDSKDQVFLLMGGWQASSNTTYSALWAYSPASNTWWQITSLHNNGSISVIPSRMASVMVWDSADNRAYIYAGSGNANTASLNDLWMIVPG